MARPSRRRTILLDVLTGERIGKPARSASFAEGTPRNVTVTVGERGAS